MVRLGSTDFLSMSSVPVLVEMSASLVISGFTRFRDKGLYCSYTCCAFFSGKDFIARKQEEVHGV